MKNLANQPNSTIEKTILTARLFDGFWDRWIAHGVEPIIARQAKHSIKDINDWLTYFGYYADLHKNQAYQLEVVGQKDKAINKYQLAGLYYNLTYWIYPDCYDEKKDWYRKSLESFSKVDELSQIKCHRERILLDEGSYFGRIRMPKQPKGSIVIINPIDSSKEELYTYEKHFLEMNYATFSFDGPGQGETFLFSDIKATAYKWKKFLNEVISVAKKKLPGVPVYLFGTSSGANWSIVASNHPDVRKAVAVSPAISSGVTLPEYFVERSQYITDFSQNMLPDPIEVTSIKPIFLFHGNKDVMVKDSDIYQLYKNLPDGKLIEYEEETHCCNGKLHEIRELADKWFQAG